MVSALRWWVVNRPRVPAWMQVLEQPILDLKDRPRGGLVRGQPLSDQFVRGQPLPDPLRCFAHGGLHGCRY